MSWFSSAPTPSFMNKQGAQASSSIVLPKYGKKQYNVHMSQIPITIKIDASLKQEAQKLAKSLGLSLSAIIENQLREVVRDRRVVFEEELIPNKKTAKMLREIQAEIKAGHNLNGPFKTFEELEEHLDSLSHAD